ncbi:MAG: phosphoenolpyruvate hydrolase family protein [Pseudomonadota bacterium]|nr:phosphoenolpyruvate hydrolase family protein [Pseudomonadota bacterium]
MTTPYVFNPAEATAMAEAGADLIVAHVGTTGSGTIGAKDVMSLDEAVSRIEAMLAAARGAKPDVLVICHGGPLAGPEETQEVLRRLPGLAGFYGASSMERLPVEIAIVENTRRFKALKLAPEV